MSRGFPSLALLTFLPFVMHAQTNSVYTQSNLVSDGSVKALQTDTQLVNPWGVAIGQATPFWINTAGTGLSEVYDTGGNKQFVVKVPAAAAGKTGSPTGIVFNASTTDFALSQGGSALFIFDALDGTVSAWNSSLTNATVVVDNSAAGAVYTGLALINNGTANFLLAANLAQNRIDVFDAKFAPATLGGNFTDPSIPSGFAPFNVHVINNQVFVMYAQQNPAGGPPLGGSGAGYVSVFDNNGKFVAHAISGGNLNAPWGLALAPAAFGAFGGDLLVGNFGDGTINAYDPASFAWKGQLQDSTGKPIQNDALWEILFGANGTGDPNTLYFTAGVNNEKGGLFGTITATAAAAAGDFTMNLAQTALTVKQGTSGTVQVSVLPANGFSSPVKFNVTGLPAGTTFQFSPASITPSAGASAASTTLTVTAGTYSAPPSSPYQSSRSKPSSISGVLAAGAIAPIALLALFPLRRNRRKFLRSLIMGGGASFLLLLSVLISGCGGTKSASAGNSTPPPTGPSTVTVTATSGSLTHTATFSLTIQ